MESWNKKNKRITIHEWFFTEEHYPFPVKPNFSTIDSIIEIEPCRAWKTSFVRDDILRDLIGFKPIVVLDESILSLYPLDIMSFVNNFPETDIAHGLIFTGKQTGIDHNWTMTVDPGYKNLEWFDGGVQWSLTESKDFVLNISFKLKNENGNIVSFKSPSIFFR